MWGALFDDLRTNNKYELSYNLIFILKVAIFMYTVFFLHDYSLFQVLIVISLSLISAGYIGRFRPLDRLFRNNIDVINEILVYVITMHMLLFTDFIDDEGLKFNIGWSMLISIFLLMIINLCIVAFFAFRSLFLVFLKIKNRV